jgi:hypothetical protein
MFNINDEVFIPKINKIKKIIDFEIILGIELYYMEDKTAYPENELISIDVCSNYLLNYKFDLMDLLEIE